jgi:hypothetical protein
MVAPSVSKCSLSAMTAPGADQQPGKLALSRLDRLAP